MRPSATRPRRPGIYLPLGVLLIMATSLFAGSGVYSFTLNSIDGRPAAKWTPIPPIALTSPLSVISITNSIR